MTPERWFEQIAAGPADEPNESAPARLTSKVYSAVVSLMARSGGLLELRETKRAGGRLCVFETAVSALPIGADMRSANPCRVCHARVLGERLAHAPIFWPGCPYSEFHHERR